MLSKACKHLQNQSFVHFAPTRFETTKVGNEFKRIERLLFPGYIFVRCDLSAKELSELRSTVGLSRVVKGMGDGPGIIPDSFIDELKNACGLRAPSEEFFRQGDKVRLINGPFVGMVGEIMSSDSNGRLMLLFDIMAGARPVWVSSRSLEGLSR